MRAMMNPQRAGALLCLLFCLRLPGSLCHAEVARPPTTIAVLDFVNRDPSGGEAWLGKGLADMLITDLSASKQLVVLERERMADITRELGLGASGLVDPSGAARVGRTAKVDWVLFGSFLRRQGQLTIEALLLDMATQRPRRVEQVAGPAEKLFDLERQLVRQVLDRLSIPMSEEELRAIERLRTDSLPALEHHGRSLDLFDRGQWLEALLEVRLAIRADPDYLKALARTADLYSQVAEKEHALVAYRRLAVMDTEDAVPDAI